MLQEWSVFSTSTGRGGDSSTRWQSEQEWCEDLFDNSFYREPEATQKNLVSTSASGSGDHVFHGGCWASDADHCR